MIPLKINGKHLCEIFDGVDISNWTDDQIIQYSVQHRMLPTSVNLTSETYSRDAERTADFELEELTLVNRKSKPEFMWDLIATNYVANLMQFLGYTYEFKNAEDVIIPVKATPISITYNDFIGQRTIQTYLGQTLSGTLIEYNGNTYWQDFRIAFPER